MDDLSGLSWTTNSNDNARKSPMSSGMLYPNARLGGISGTSTPASASSGPSKPATPATDSFANLVSFGSKNADKNLPLLERQKKLQEEKTIQETERRNRYEAQYGEQNSQFWNTLENKSPQHTPAPTTSTSTTTTDEDDLLAAFNASAPVDASTYFPVSDSNPSPQIETTPSPHRTMNKPASLHQGNGMSMLDDDDDPFGLSQLNQKPPPSTTTAQPQPVINDDDDDDFLGLLGKPVSEIPRPQPQAQPQAEPPESLNDDRSPSPPKPTEGMDHSIAELVDMGFPADKARQALSTTESGTDIQAAVGWLLTQAHAESRQKTQKKAAPSRGDSSSRSEGRLGQDVGQYPSPAGKNASQAAAGFGNNLLKTANSWWKTGSKTVHRVVNDLNTEHDPNTPRWMREASLAQESPQLQQPSSRERQQMSGPPQEKSGTLTDEALLLEAQPAKPLRRSPHPTDTVRHGADNNLLQTQPSPADSKRAPQPKLPQRPRQPQPPPPPQRVIPNDTPKSRLSKTAIEEQSAQAYVSPARRRRPQPTAPSPEVDLLQSSAPTATAVSKPSPAASIPQRPRPSPQSVPPTASPARPKAPPRNVPELSPAALSSLHRHREKGTDAYKKGDYAAAHESFTAALGTLPDKHPIAIIIYSNRAMTAMKIGEPKVSASDADNMLSIIGPSRGEAETIDLGNGEPAKQMKDFFGKALMRKAEALEQLERWADAAKTWKQAVEISYGGSTSIQGRNRCEKAAGITKPPPSKPPPAKRPAAAAAPKKPAVTTGNSEAVSRLREANKAAGRTDEERHALADRVDARIAAWKGGKQDNLRALLGSLDTVLWPEAGWKKVNMSELIMPNKVKIQYMKGISKVHPDKVWFLV